MMSLVEQDDMAERISPPPIPARFEVHGPRLFRDDVVELRDMLIARCRKVAIETPHFRYGPSEMGRQDHEDRVMRLLVRTDDPSARIEIGREKAVVTASAPDDASAGLAYSVAGLLKQKAPWHQRGVLRQWPNLVAIVAAYPFTSRLMEMRTSDGTVWPFWVAAFIVIGIAMAIAERLGLGGARVYLATRRADADWLARNRDIVLAVLGLMLGPVVSMLFDRWFK